MAQQGESGWLAERVLAVHVNRYSVQRARAQPASQTLPANVCANGPRLASALDTLQFCAQPC
jgi:hypothetical protein